MYKLKELAQRSMAFAVAVTFFSGVASYALPALTFADALNPLTERTLMLSSSSPGWLSTDGSGNATYAAPGTGPNGLKTAETFSFRVSTDSNAANTPLKAFSFEYCITAAGACTAPGNGGVDTVNEESNLDLNYSSADYGTDFGIYTSAPNGATAADNAPSLVGAGTDAWTLTTSVGAGTTQAPEADANTHNYMTIAWDSSTFEPDAGDKMWIKFYADDDDHITNPGEGAFFVRLNTYSDEAMTTVVDGGVTVANVMNESIQIQTKVLETMAFSVGTQNPDTVVQTPGPPEQHGPCDTITQNNPVNLGDPDTEYALSFNESFDGYSWWRLSSNSSGGATVYYSGYTLSNTVGDQIDEIGGGAGTNDDPLTTTGDGDVVSNKGQEQFGLAVDSTPDTLDTADTPGLTNSIAPLTPDPAYDSGAGEIDEEEAGPYAKFAFDSDANEVAEPIASDSDNVLTCATAKMRYIANIAPFTPAGIYTAKINYIAAPEY